MAATWVSGPAPARYRAGMDEEGAAPPSREETTQILAGADSRGARATITQVFPAVYEELQAMARRQLAGESAQATLNTNALVHEAYLRLVDQTRVVKRGRSYFFAAAAQAMRRVLVDAARRRAAAKRGGDVRPVTLAEDQVRVDGFALEIMALDDALERLSEESPRMASVVEARFFGGLTYPEIAEALDVSERTVKYDWAMARAWLQREIEGGGPGP